MHQLLSLISSLILSPVNWIIILFALSFLLKAPRTKKICRFFALGIFLLFSNAWLLNTYAQYWNPEPYNISNDSTYSCGIVLGGFGSPDLNNNGYFNSTSDRFIQTLKMYKMGKINHILISGGNGKKDNVGFSEAEWVKQELIVMGVPDSVIFDEDRSNNTADNTLNTRHLLDSIQLKPPYLLITSAVHIPRSVLLFNKAGIKVTAFPCNYIAGRDHLSFWSILPNPELLTRWEPYLRETAGYLFYQVR